MSDAATVPDKPALEGLEAKWGEAWEREGTHRFDRAAAIEGGRDSVFSIDTPPPTASGSLHIGHVFSYTHMDLAARFQRMRGKHLFYPMGWDDNGLPTERRVQNYYGVRCDPTLPYVEGYTPPLEGGEADGTAASGKAADQVPISRRNFIELCERLTVEDEQQFETLWRDLGLSVDWSLTYRTIGPEAQRAAQRAFLRNLARGEAYQADAPTLWDVTFRTAVAQAELEDKDQPAAFHRVTFHQPDGGTIEIETTRPELLPACVALVAHPDDERYQPSFGTTVTTPLFGVEVPVVAHHLAQQEKGSGIAMICTFGDVTDVVWWRELDLPARAVIGKDGRLLADAPAADLFTDDGRAAYAELAGKTVFSAKARIVELLRESGDLIGDPKPTTHAVKFFEKGDKPLEIVTTRQWYIANGARDEKLRETLLAAGKAIDFHPDFMRVRYENWVGGLTGDSLISRQRFFGVPIPVWYPLDAEGEPLREQPSCRARISSRSTLLGRGARVTPGAARSAERLRGRARHHGHVGDIEPDPADPGGWVVDDELFGLVFPYDLRSQGQDVIRTWLFSTVLRAQLEHGSIPWYDAGVSGFIVDPDRKSCEVEGQRDHARRDARRGAGSDGVRYWAAQVRASQQRDRSRGSSGRCRTPGSRRRAADRRSRGRPRSRMRCAAYQRSTVVNASTAA